MEFEIENVRVASQTILGADWSRARDHIGATGSIDARKRTENVATYWNKRSWELCRNCVRWARKRRGIPRFTESHRGASGGSKSLNRLRNEVFRHHSVIVGRFAFQACLFKPGGISASPSPFEGGGSLNLLPFDANDVGNNRVSATCEEGHSRRMSNLDPIGNTRGQPDCAAERQTIEFELENWRRRPDLNRGSRFCRFSQVVNRVVSCWSLVGPAPPLCPVLGPYWTTSGLQTFRTGGRRHADDARVRRVERFRRFQVLDRGPVTHDRHESERQTPAPRLERRRRRGRRDRPGARRRSRPAW